MTTNVKYQLTYCRAVYAKLFLFPGSGAYFLRMWEKEWRERSSCCSIHRWEMTDVLPQHRTWLQPCVCSSITSHQWVIEHLQSCTVMQVKPQGRQHFQPKGALRHSWCWGELKCYLSAVAVSKNIRGIAAASCHKQGSGAALAPK